MKVTIAPDFEKLFRPLTESEYEQAVINNLADPKHERIPPVAVWDNHGKTIVDGHNTYKIRTKHGLHIRYFKVRFDSRDEALEYAVRCQLGRRNLTPSEMAMAIAKLPKTPPQKNEETGRFERRANLRVGENEESAEEETEADDAPMTREELAAEHGISARTLSFADKVTSHGSAELQQAVIRNVVTVSDAAAVCELSKAEQNALVRLVKAGEAKTLREAVQVRESGGSSKPKKEPPKPKLPKDKFGTEVPESLAPTFETVQWYAKASSALATLAREAAQFREANRPGTEWLRHQEIENRVKQLKLVLRAAKPVAPCPTCKGKPSKTCKHCKGLNYITASHLGRLTHEEKAWLELR